MTRKAALPICGHVSFSFVGKSGTKAGKRPSGSHTATAIREVHSTLHTSIATNVASDGGDLSFFFPFKKPLVLILGWQQMMVMGISYFSTKPELEAPFFFQLEPGLSLFSPCSMITPRIKSHFFPRDRDSC